MNAGTGSDEDRSGLSTGLAALSKALGLVSLESTSVQHALRGLAIKNILSKSPRGVYTFESVAFERWVRTLAP